MTALRFAWVSIYAKVSPLNDQRLLRDLICVAMVDKVNAFDGGTQAEVEPWRTKECRKIAKMATRDLKVTSGHDDHYQVAR